MLGFVFGLNARIGRLHYFFSLVGFGIVLGLFVFAVTGATLKSGDVTMLTSLTKGWPSIMLASLCVAVTVTLQSMRFRDMGWDPVCVIPGWMALLIIDRLIATKMPALSLGPQNPQTIVGALVNLGLVLALLFWPGTEAPDSGAPRRTDDAPARRSTVADRMARISGGH